MREAKALEEEAERLEEEAMELQDEAATLLSMTWKEEQAIRQCTLALETDLKCLRSSFDSISKKNLATLDPKTADKIVEELYRARCLISEGDVAALLQYKDHGRFLKMFLGPVNVRATRKEVQHKVKEEYNSYRV